MSIDEIRKQAMQQRNVPKYEKVLMKDVTQTIYVSVK